MKRRPFSVPRRRLLAGGAALGFGPALQAVAAGGATHASTGGTDFDVAVIGGGFAGATAARELGRAGYRVVLLEARERLGGRTYSGRFADRDVEIGGAWVHWLQPYVWAEMERYGLGVVEDPFTGLDQTRVLGNDGRARVIDPDQFLVDIRDGFEKFCHDVWEVFPRPYEPLHNPRVYELDKLSCADRIAELDLSETQRIQLNSFMALYGGNVTSKFGLPGMLKIYAAGGWNYDAFADAETHYRIAGGTDALISRMVDDSGCDLRLATPVTAVAHDQSSVRITTAGGRALSARAAVLTLPLNCYPDISFTPALSPDKRAWIDEGMISRGAKLFVHLKENLGRVFAFSDEQYPLNWVQTIDYGDDYGTLLTVTVARAETIALDDRAAVAREVQRLLGKVTVTDSVGYDWAADQYAKGAWPAYAVGQLSRLPALQRPEGALFFAGAITANGWHEFIDGAVESGLRAGREVREFLDG